MTSEPTVEASANLIALQHLIDVVAKLRSPDGGCPWDLEQTPKSLIPYVIEEAYAGGDMLAGQPAIRVLTEDIVEDQILRNDHVALHPDHLGDVSDAARAVT